MCYQLLLDLSLGTQMEAIHVIFLHAKKDLMNATTITAIAAVIGGILGILKYFNYRSRQDELRLIANDFHAVVAALRSDSQIERLAGAISLRRFFDKRGESGKDIPYAKEAVDVTAAILRGQAISDFQKLLADGLAYAVNLHKTDLQKTNLQFAYLVAKEKDARSHAGVRIDLSKADFYRADLSGASLKGAFAQEAVFYQARLHRTVLSKADLSGANFFEADLKDAKFDGAIMDKAIFRGARNIPEELLQKLDNNGIYDGNEPFHEMRHSAESLNPVFVSKPGYVGYQDQQKIASVLAKLEDEGIDSVALERPDYPSFGALGELRRMVTGCVGMIIFGLPDLQIEKGSWRTGTPEETAVENSAFATPWSQIEAGMALMQGMPILVVCEKPVRDGIFENSLTGPGIYYVSTEDNLNGEIFQNTFSNWCSDVREQARMMAMKGV